MTRSIFSRYLASALLLTGGAGLALHVATRKTVSDLPAASEIKERLQQIQQTSGSPSLRAPAGGGNHPAAPAPAREISPAAPVHRNSPRSEAGAAADMAGAGPGISASAPESPVKSLALMGVTSVGASGPQAWMVNTENGERETGHPGDEVFGFTLKAISEDAVLLARNGEEWHIELGERTIPAAVAPEDESDGRPGGGGSEDSRQRMRERMGRMASASTETPSSGFGRSFRGGSPRSFSSSGGFSRPSFSPSYSSRMRSSAPARTFTGGGFSGGGFRPGSGGVAGGARSSRPAATSNPQAARRTGASLTGGSQPLPRVRQLSNPQTARRRGTAGAAFGEIDNRLSSRSNSNAGAAGSAGARTRSR